MGKDEDFWNGVKRVEENLRTYLLKALCIEPCSNINEIRDRIVVRSPLSIVDILKLVEEGDKEDMVIISALRPEDLLEYRGLTKLRDNLENFVNEKVIKEINKRKYQ